MPFIPNSTVQTKWSFFEIATLNLSAIASNLDGICLLKDSDYASTSDCAIEKIATFTHQSVAIIDHAVRLKASTPFPPAHFSILKILETEVIPAQLVLTEARRALTQEQKENQESLLAERDRMKAALCKLGRTVCDEMPSCPPRYFISTHATLKKHATLLVTTFAPRSG